MRKEGERKGRKGKFKGKTCHHHFLLQSCANACKVDCHTTKTAKIEKEGDITLHHIDKMAMCSRVITFFIFAGLVVYSMYSRPYRSL